MLGPALRRLLLSEELREMLARVGRSKGCLEDLGPGREGFSEG